MVSIGKPVEELLADPGAEDNFQYSIEFCGGTHLGNTSGVRRHVVHPVALLTLQHADMRYQQRSSCTSVICGCSRFR